MKISIVSFTSRGLELSRKLKQCLNDYEVHVFTKCSSYPTECLDITFIENSIGQWTKEMMEQKNALIFIGACGIAVRAIAPNIVSKLEDSPVIVMDEMGHYVIPVLSGHFGGANALAVLIAEKSGAQPVITTATDVNHKFAVDVFAKANDLFIENKEGIAKVSSKVLRGEMIKIAIEEGHWVEKNKVPKAISLVTYPPEEAVDVVITSENKVFDAALTLRPKEYVIGAGCRKGKNYSELEQFITETLAKAGITVHQVYALASIDVKAKEAAMIQWRQVHKVPFITYSKEQLEDVEGDFRESEFVKKMVGVGNVCERAALKAAGLNGKLIFEKYAEDGMTLAIAKRGWSVTFDE